MHSLHVLHWYHALVLAQQDRLRVLNYVKNCLDYCHDWHMELALLAGQKLVNIPFFFLYHAVIMCSTWAAYASMMPSEPELAPLGCQLGFNLCQSSLCLVQSLALGLHYLDHAAIHI